MTLLDWQRHRWRLVGMAAVVLWKWDGRHRWTGQGTKVTLQTGLWVAVAVAMAVREERQAVMPTSASS